MGISEQLARLQKYNKSEKPGESWEDDADEKETCSLSGGIGGLVPVKLELPEKFCRAFGLTVGSTVRIYIPVPTDALKNKSALLDALAEIASMDYAKLDAWGGSSTKWGDSGGKWESKSRSYGGGYNRKY
jgi:hypothetical protein